MCKDLGIPNGRVMVCGEGENDVTMHQWAKLHSAWGVAPANSDQSVKKVALEVLPLTNNEDAIAVVLEDAVAQMSMEIQERPRTAKRLIPGASRDRLPWTN